VPRAHHPQLSAQAPLQARGRLPAGLLCLLLISHCTAAASPLLDALRPRWAAGKTYKHMALQPHQRHQWTELTGYGFAPPRRQSAGKGKHQGFSKPTRNAPTNSDGRGVLYYETPPVQLQAPLCVC